VISVLYSLDVNKIYNIQRYLTVRGLGLTCAKVSHSI